MTLWTGNSTWCQVGVALPAGQWQGPLESGYVLRFFGQPNTGTGDFQGGLQEHLYLNNGPLGSLIATGKESLF